MAWRRSRRDANVGPGMTRVGLPPLPQSRAFAGVEQTLAFTPLSYYPPWQAPGGGGSGRRANPPQNQYPAIYPGLQLWNGVAGLRSGWFFPWATPTPATAPPQIFGNQHPSNYPGGPRLGQTYKGDFGMNKIQRMRLAVTDAQVRQSGLSATRLGASLLATTGIA